MVLLGFLALVVSCESPTGGNTEKVTEAVITDMNLTGKVIAPVKLYPLSTGFDSAQYSGTIDWEDGDGEPVAGSFAAGTVYRATVNLGVKNGFTFAGVGVDSFAWSGYGHGDPLRAGQGQIHNAANSGRITISFPATAAADEDTPVNLFSLDTLFALPVTGGVPLGDFAESSQYTGTLRWFNDEDISVSETFAASVAYKVKIALTAKPGYTLAGIASNAFIHTGASSVTWDGETEVVSVIFPGTGEDTALVNNLFLDDKVIAPMAGLAPVTAFPGTDQYSGSIAWETVSGGAAGANFAAGTAYRAVVTLAAKPGWTFGGLGENAFSYSGATSISNGPGSGVVAIVFSPTPKPPSNWMAISPGSASEPGDTTFGNSVIYAVSYGGGRFVAGGSNGKIAWSANGIQWTAVEDSPLSSIQSIAYDGGKYVAGSFGEMAWSTDGIQWTAVENYPFESLTTSGIAYGDGKYVAVSSGGNWGNMAWSTDGIYWTVISHGSTSEPGDTTFGSSGIYTVSYGDGRFVAAGASGKMAWSTDGIHWTAIRPGSATYPGDTTFGSSAIYAVSYGGRWFVAVGADGKMAWSSNGIHWTAISPGDTTFGNSSIRAVCYGGRAFVAAGYDGKMAWSSNGTNWVAVNDSSFGTSVIYGVAYGDGTFVAVGAAGKAAYSAGSEQ
jgi:hypothetical protein